MDWPFRKRSSARRLFVRHEHNRMMLEQYLSGIEARYIVLAETMPKDHAAALAEVGDVIGRFRKFRATAAGEAPTPLPDWNEAFMAELVLDQLLPADEARGEMAMQLAALKVLEPSTHAVLSAEWTEVTKDGATPTDGRLRALLVSARRANQWEGTERWIIRNLGLHYASRLRFAFITALVLAIILIFAEATLGPSMLSAGVSGLGFATAAGLLGASFSAMVGQDRAFHLRSVEEASAATSKQMIWLRLGVGVAAAIIVYFFFEAGLVEGVLFPDLQQIGFGRVAPIGDEIAGLRANAQSLEASAAALMETIGTVNERIAAVADAMPQSDSPGAADVQRTTFGTDVVLATEQLKDKLLVTGTELNKVGDQITGLQAEWARGNRPLGSLAPNPDLSKLVVWCFAAGFTQTLVPSLLAKVTPQEVPKKTGES
jgi:hypothetical protein